MMLLNVGCSLVMAVVSVSSGCMAHTSCVVHVPVGCWAPKRWVPKQSCQSDARVTQQQSSAQHMCCVYHVVFNAVGCCCCCCWWVSVLVKALISEESRRALTESRADVSRVVSGSSCELSTPGSGVLLTSHMSEGGSQLASRYTPFKGDDLFLARLAACTSGSCVLESPSLAAWLTKQAGSQHPPNFSFPLIKQRASSGCARTFCTLPRAGSGCASAGQLIDNGVVPCSRAALKLSINN